jgi:hypothetical protein
MELGKLLQGKIVFLDTALKQVKEIKVIVLEDYLS